MGDFCNQCDFDAEICTECALGYYPQGKKCVTIPEVCGDGLYNLKEECDDGNTEDGDGCDSKCKVEVNYKCKLSRNEGPFYCFEKRMTKIYWEASKVKYD